MKCIVISFQGNVEKKVFPNTVTMLTSGEVSSRIKMLGEIFEVEEITQYNKDYRQVKMTCRKFPGWKGNRFGTDEIEYELMESNEQT